MLIQLDTVTPKNYPLSSEARVALFSAVLGST